MAWDTDLDPNGVTNANAAAPEPRVRVIAGSESHIHDLIMPTAAWRSNGGISVVANVRFGSKADIRAQRRPNMLIAFGATMKRIRV